MVRLAEIKQSGFLKKPLQLASFLPIIHDLSLEGNVSNSQGTILIYRPNKVATTLLLRLNQSEEHLQLYHTYPTIKDDIYAFFQLVDRLGSLINSKNFFLDGETFDYSHIGVCLEKCLENNTKQLQLLLKSATTEKDIEYPGAFRPFFISKEFALPLLKKPDQEQYNAYVQLLLKSQNTN